MATNAVTVLPSDTRAGKIVARYSSYFMDCTTVQILTTGNYHGKSTRYKCQYSGVVYQGQSNRLHASKKNEGPQDKLTSKASFARG